MCTITTTARVLAATLRIRFAVLLALASMTLSVNDANGVTIADFQFTGPSFVSADAGTNWTTGSLTTVTQVGDVGLPLTTSAGGTSSGVIGNPTPAAEVQYADLENQTTSDVTLADSIALDNYYSFIVTPTGSASLNLDELTFEFARTGGAAATAHVFSSVDGFTAIDEIDSFTPVALSTLETATIDVSALSDITTPVELRIYLTRVTASNVANSIFTDNILLTGTVTLPPVPEPSSLMLLGLGALGLVRHMRRRGA